MLKVSGASAFKASLDGLTARFAVAAHSVADKGALLLQNVAREHATVSMKVRSGSLRRGIIAIPAVAISPFSFMAQVASTVVYARLMEKGGIVKAKPGSFLVWTADASGNPTPRPTGPDGWRLARQQDFVHFALQVTIKPHPYFEPARMEVAPLYRELAKAEFAAARAR